MTQERRFLAALQATNTYRLDGDRLTLSDSTGPIQLRFSPSDTTGSR
jgi:heat shock protein HslJ